MIGCDKGLSPAITLGVGMLRTVVTFPTCPMLLENQEYPPAGMCTVDQECPYLWAQSRGFRDVRTVCSPWCTFL